MEPFAIRFSEAGRSWDPSLHYYAREHGIALDTAEGLKTLVPKTNGHAPTLEDVFIALTGGRMEDNELEVVE